MNFVQKIWQAVTDWLSSPARLWGGLFDGGLRFPLLSGRKTAKAAALEKMPRAQQSTTPLVIRQDEEHASPDYTQLKARFRDIGMLGAIEETMGRDALTVMPEGGWKSRLAQIAYLQGHLHEILTAPNVAAQLEQAKAHQAAHPEDWDQWDSANLTDMEAMYRQACAVGSDLVEKKASLSHEGRRIHRDALTSGDWPKAREFLTKTVDLSRQIADAECKALGFDSQYEALISHYAPGMRLADIEGWFGTLEKKLKILLPQTLEKQAAEDAPHDITDFYPARAQMWLNHAVLETVGFDFKRGGLYETGHNPVEGGTPDDTRLVIKNVDTTDFLLSLRSTLHEGGHGIYTQGLPRKTWRYQPVAQDLGTATHESQALLVEMIVGRMPEFFAFLSPRLEGLFHGLNNPALSADNLYRLRTRVKPSMNRRAADEVTYFFHVLLRFRLEKQLIEGTLELDDLPEAWNSGMEQLLGIRPQSDKEGCLQDVHWFVCKFGYFPAYTLGHMMAAQFFAAMEKAVPHLRQHIAAGNFAPAHEWLKENIYSKGSLLPWDELVKQATGKPLSPDALIAHLEKRYLG